MQENNAVVENSFEVTWWVNDGVGETRPHVFTVYQQDLDGATDADLQGLFWKVLHNDVDQKVSIESDQEEAFTAWSKKVVRR